MHVNIVKLLQFDHYQISPWRCSFMLPNMDTLTCILLLVWLLDRWSYRVSTNQQEQRWCDYDRDDISSCSFEKIKRISYCYGFLYIISNICKERRNTWNSLYYRCLALYLFVVNCRHHNNHCTETIGVPSLFPPFHI